MIEIFGNQLLQITWFCYLAEMPGSSTCRYFGAIDGLRLLASVNIVLFHLQRMGGLYDLRGKPEWLFIIIKAPLFHASMFFILGGFIFTAKFASRVREFNSLAFWKQRFFDLYPLHAITILLMVPLYLLKNLPGPDTPWQIVLSCLVHLALLYSFMPMGILPFNRPSWALSGFALCYLLLKPLLVFINRFQTRRSLLLLMAACLLPSLAWAYLYSRTPWSHNVYFFFHVFAPVRLFEFILGMAVARLYMLKNTDRKKNHVTFTHRLFSDAIVVACIILLFICCKYRGGTPLFWRYQLYHTWMLLPYAVLVYYMCCERGYLCRVFTVPLVRWLGQCSFYPYMLHLPLIGWICWFCENVLDYKTFMHHTYTIAGFMVVLYLGSAWVWHRMRR